MNRTRARRGVLPLLIAATLLTLNLGSVVNAGTLRPTPAQAPNDVEELWHNGCFTFFESIKPVPNCVFGDLTSSYKVAIVGDSHTSDFFPAFNAIALARHWRLYTFVKADCPFIDIPIFNAATMRPYPHCLEYDQAVLARLQQLQPDLTITIPFRWIYPRDAAQNSPQATGAAIGRMLAQVPGLKVVIVDSPYSNRNVPTCVALHGADACAIPRKVALSGGVKIREHEAAVVGGGRYLNLTPLICAGWPCRVVTDGILEFRDQHHLTATYTASLTSIVDAGLKRVLHLPD